MIKSSSSSANLLPSAKSETFESVSDNNLGAAAGAGGAVIKIKHELMDNMDDIDKYGPVKLLQSLTCPPVDCNNGGRDLTQNCNCDPKLECTTTNPHPLLEKIITIKTEPGICQTDDNDDDVPHITQQQEDNFTATDPDPTQSISANDNDNDLANPEDGKAKAGSNLLDEQQETNRIMFEEVKVFPSPAISLEISSSWMKNNDNNSISSSKNEAATTSAAVVLKQQYSCKTCNKTFRTNGQLSTHLCTKSAAPSRFTCQYCANCFPQENILSRHLKWMSDVRNSLHPHPKEIPSSSSSINPTKTRLGGVEAAASAAAAGSSRNIKNDKDSISTIPQQANNSSSWKKYRCKYCSKCFSTTYQRGCHQNAVHFDIIHSDKYINCPKCEQSFHHKSALTKHLRKWCKNINQ